VACDLTDRVVLTHSELTLDLLPARRDYRGANVGSPFLAWRDVKSIAKEMGIRRHGRFTGAGVESQALEDAQTARKALTILDRAKPRPDAVILLRDSDGRPERQRGLDQARGEPGYQFSVAIGVANTKRECWVLSGFVPTSHEERERHKLTRQELGFDPCISAHELTAKHDEDKRSAKRVLRFLTGGDWERERVCWAETDLGILRSRGKTNGIDSFIDELSRFIVPLFARK